MVAFFGMYMTLSYSEAFWEGVPYVSFLQFPWRFLAVVIFAIAVLGGLIFTYIEDKKQQQLAVAERRKQIIRKLLIKPIK